MTLAQSFPLQQRIYDLVSAAVAPVPVFDHQPHTPPDKFVRLDGFNMMAVAWKNAQQGRHAFEVHVFLRPVNDAGPRGRKEPMRILSLAHQAITEAPILGTTAILEYMDGSFDSDAASTNVMARYTIVL